MKQQVNALKVGEQPRHQSVPRKLEHPSVSLQQIKERHRNSVNVREIEVSNERQSLIMEQLLKSFASQQNEEGRLLPPLKITAEVQPVLTDNDELLRRIGSTQNSLQSLVMPDSSREVKEVNYNSRIKFADMEELLKREVKSRRIAI
jgi:hypothetical protein